MKIAEALGEISNVVFLLPKIGHELARDYLCAIPRFRVLSYTTAFEENRHANMYMVYLFRLMKSTLLALRSGSDYDLIISNSQLPFDLIPAIAFKIISGSPLVVYFHHGSPCIRRNFSLRNIVSRFSFQLSVFLSRRYANLIFAINSSLRDYLLAERVSSEVVALTNNGVDFRRIEDVEKGEIEYDSAFLGRIDRIKGAYDLLTVWNRVVKQDPSAKLCIIGDGPDLQTIKKRSREMGLSKNIVFLGEIGDDEKYRILKRSKTFVYPSYQESWGIVVAEAMACGLPVVAYDLPVYVEIFGYYVMTVRFGDTKSMADTIGRILAEYDKYKTFGEESKAFISKYDWKSIQESEISRLGRITND